VQADGAQLDRVLCPGCVTRRSSRSGRSTGLLGLARRCACADPLRRRHAPRASSDPRRRARGGGGSLSRYSDRRAAPLPRATGRTASGPSRGTSRRPPRERSSASPARTACSPEPGCRSAPSGRRSAAVRRPAPVRGAPRRRGAASLQRAWARPRASGSPRPASSMRPHAEEPRVRNARSERTPSGPRGRRADVRLGRLGARRRQFARRMESRAARRDEWRAAR
jgi:hypothetical protein